jgi:pyruvate/2-oxoglutarate dehydrogenase complex dihydrolipoamide dehydrogenase (E3) component
VTRLKWWPGQQWMFYLGRARFTKPNAVAVDGRELRFDKAVIATGSRPAAPRIEGLREGEYT